MNSPIPQYSFSISQVPTVLLLAGSLAIAIISIIFFWGLVEYTFQRGDDAKRAHAKLLMLTASITLFLLLILWWFISFFGGLLPPSSS